MSFSSQQLVPLLHQRPYTSTKLSGDLKLKTLRTAVLACSCLVVASASAQTTDAALAADPVFKKNCAKCHGKTAEGRHFGGPSLVAEKVSSASSDELRAIITNGKGRMPKYTGKLTAEEIDTLVQQIKAMKAK